MRRSIHIKGKNYRVPEAVFDYIYELSHETSELTYKINKLEYQLADITPIVESKNYKPAMSADCRECRYVVKQDSIKFGSSIIIGCRKDNVCADFMPEE